LNLIAMARLWLLVALFLPLSAWATMESAYTLLLNFTNLTSAKTMAKWSDRIDIGNMGLGWAGPTNASRDIWIESVPHAVGWSWRPVIAVSFRRRSRNVQFESTEMLGALRVDFSGG